MAVPAGTLQTHQAIGNREDLDDIMWDISPTETPFVTRLEREKVKSRMPEWLVDQLDPPASNAQIEGDDATTNTAAPPTRLRNYTQILSKTARVSDSQEEVDHAGRESEMNYQVRKRMEEVKRDLEYACVRNQASTAGAAAAAATMASVESWLATNKTSVGTGTAQTTPGYSSGTVAAPTDSTVAGTATESAMKSVIQAIYTAGGNARTIMVGPGTKAKISSSFTGIATRYQDVPGGKQATITGGVDLYVSDFGKHVIVPNRIMRDQNVLLLDMDYWALGQLRPIKARPLAKTGDSDRKQVIMEATLFCRNEKASGKVTDINPAL